jgi:hypothetical protein
LIALEALDVADGAAEVRGAGAEAEEVRGGGAEACLEREARRLFGAAAAAFAFMSHRWTGAAGPWLVDGAACTAAGAGVEPTAAALSPVI